MVAAIGGGALLAGCGSGGSSTGGSTGGETSSRQEAGGGAGVSEQELQEAEEKFENGEGPAQEQIEEISRKGNEIAKEATEGLANDEGASEQKLKEVEEKAKELVEEVGEWRPSAPGGGWVGYATRFRLRRRADRVASFGAVWSNEAGAVSARTVSGSGLPSSTGRGPGGAARG